MSIFSKLNKTQRAEIFSGKEFSGDKMPSGQTLEDGSVFSITKEGAHTFKPIRVKPGKSIFGRASIWACDKKMDGNLQIEKRSAN